MKGKKVVVFDDEADIREILCYNLSNAGFEVISFESPVSGYESIRNIHPDIILSDWLMPDMSGIELCQKLKEDYSLRNIPLLMISCKGGESDIALAFQTGVDDYLVKPFRISELVGRIHHLLEKQEELAT